MILLSSLSCQVGEVVPAREGLRLLPLRLLLRFHRQVGEVVPAREGLRPTFQVLSEQLDTVGEVVPAREGLRQCVPNKHPNSLLSERLFQLEKD